MAAYRLRYASGLLLGCAGRRGLRGGLLGGLRSPLLGVLALFSAAAAAAVFLPAFVAALLKSWPSLPLRRLQTACCRQENLRRRLGKV